MNFVQIKNRFKQLALVFLVLPFALHAQDSFVGPYDNLFLSSKDHSFYNCSSSNVPLFKEPVNSIIEIEIKTDFQKLFTTKKSDQTRIEGQLSYTYNGNKVDLPIKIKARGNTRFEYCKYKPLLVNFSSSLKSTIFEGMEGNLYINAHCGEKDGDQWIFKGTKSEHINRLLAEYYIYSVLETLETITRSVSLCKIKYINIDGSVLDEELAFVLESYDDVADRCGLVKNKKKVKYLYKSSLRNTELINQFITNYDWKYQYSDSTGWTGHNIKFLKSKKKVGYFLPYDFDLNAIVYPEYWRNTGESFDEHCYNFQEFLRSKFSDEKKLEPVYAIYINIPTVRALIEDSYMDATYKQGFLYWIESYEFIIRNHLSQYEKYKSRLIN